MSQQFASNKFDEYLIQCFLTSLSLSNKMSSLLSQLPYNNLVSQLPYNVLKRTVNPAPGSVEAALTMTMAGASGEIIGTLARDLVTQTTTKVSRTVRSGLRHVPFASYIYRRKRSEKQIETPKIEVLMVQGEGESVSFAIVRALAKLSAKIWLNLVLEVIVVFLRLLG
ncbi:hypothetical protein HDE_03470 [Halotydeus destructor]|nr:hypothetical protein HDE_03470 [Halotydeus destructor]